MKTFLSKLLAATLLFMPGSVPAGTVEFNGDGSGTVSFIHGGTGTWGLSSFGAEAGAAFVTDSFTDTDNDELSAAHTGELGATWTEHPSYSAGNCIITTNRLRTSDSNVAGYYSSGIPATADYYVEAVIYQNGNVITGFGPMGRMSTTVDTGYWVRNQSSSGQWQLYKSVAGTATQLGTHTEATTNSASYTIRLLMVGSSIKVFKAGVEIISVTDSSITAAGRVGIRGTSSGTSGHYIDSITAVNQ